MAAQRSYGGIRERAAAARRAEGGAVAAPSPHGHLLLWTLGGAALGAGIGGYVGNAMSRLDNSGSNGPMALGAAVGAGVGGAVVGGSAYLGRHGVSPLLVGLGSGAAAGTWAYAVDAHNPQQKANAGKAAPIYFGIVGAVTGGAAYANRPHAVAPVVQVPTPVAIAPEPAG